MGDKIEKSRNKMKIAILTITAVTAQNYRGELRSGITNVSDIADQMLTGPFTTADADDYGCTGRGVFNPFEKTVGKPVDQADAAFYKWKKCIQCARRGGEKTVPLYNFDKSIQSCVDDPVGRPI